MKNARPVRVEIIRSEISSSRERHRSESNSSRRIVAPFFVLNETKRNFSTSIDSIRKENSTKMTTRFLCASCHNLLVEPKFISCGHRYCSRCLTNLIKFDCSTRKSSKRIDFSFSLDSSSLCSVEICQKTIDKTKVRVVS